MKFATTLIIILVVAGIAGAHETEVSWAKPPVDPDAGSGGHGFFKAIVDSFDSPEDAPMGLDWVEANGVLYHVNELSGTNAYAIDPDGGSATLLFDIAAVVGNADVGANGLCYVSERQGEYLYTVDWNGSTGSDDTVYKFTLGGALANSFPISSFCSGAAGVCYDGTNFWVSCSNSAQIVKCSGAFEPLAYYPHPGGSGSGGGMDYDPATGLYYAMDLWSEHIYVLNADMVVQDDFPAGRLGGSALGLCVGRSRSGRTLFFSNYALNRIYEIEDQFVSPVEQASWGTVKGMYR